MDPEARSLMKSLLAHKLEAIAKEYYEDAKKAKQQADVVAAIGRRLVALKKLQSVNS